MASTPFQSALTKARRKRPAKFAPSLPPLGSFDPSILLTYGQNTRGANDAQDQFDLANAQAQDNFAIQTGRLGQSEQQALADIATGKARTQEDYGTRTADLRHNYEIQAARQGEGALKANVQSTGLLKQALEARLANRAHDQAGLDTALSRSVADSTTAETRTRTGADQQRSDLALNLARLFGSGKDGNPLGTNTLNLIQAKNNATAGNLDLSGVAYQQAAANGYTLPRRKKRNVIV